MTWITDGKHNWTSALLSLNTDINYTGSQYGFIHNSGIWNQSSFPASLINPPGGDGSAARNTTMGTLMFSDAAVETICGQCQLTGGWMSGTNVNPAIHIMSNVGTEPESGANAVVVRFQYKVLQNGDAWNQSTYTNSDKTITLGAFVGGAPVIQLVDLADINMSTYVDGTVIVWRMQRIGTDDADNYPDELHLVELNIPFKRNTLGSIAKHGDAF